MKRKERQTIQSSEFKSIQTPQPVSYRKYNNNNECALDIQTL